jgi:hypothetical protein
MLHFPINHLNVSELDRIHHTTERSFRLVYEHDRLVSFWMLLERPIVLTTSCCQNAAEETDRFNRCKAEQCVAQQAILKKLVVGTSSTSSGLWRAGMNLSNNHYRDVLIYSVGCLLPEMICISKAADHLLLTSCLRVTN